MTEPSMTPDVALARLQQYREEKTHGLRVATYDSGTERALHQIATVLAAEVDRMHLELAEVRTDSKAKIREAAELAHRARTEGDRLRAELAAGPNCAQVLREAYGAIEDRACDADFTEEPMFIVGLRSAVEVVRSMADAAERGQGRG